MFSSTNQEDVETTVYTEDIIHQLDILEEVEKETYSMIPIYKNQTSNDCWVILKVTKEDIELMKPHILNRFIPKLTKYKRNTPFGYGIETFQKDIVEYYKTKPNYSYIEILIDTSNILNTTTIAGFKRLHSAYEILKSENIICETDEQLFNQLNKISLDKYSGILGLHATGNSLFKGSRLGEYIGSTIVIYDESIIKEVRFRDTKGQMV